MINANEEKDEESDEELNKEEKEQLYTGLDVDKIEQLAQDEKIIDDCIKILEKNDEDNKEKHKKSQDENIQDNKKENQENSSKEIPNQEIENQENEDLLAPPDGIYPTK